MRLLRVEELVGEEERGGCERGWGGENKRRQEYAGAKVQDKRIIQKVKKGKKEKKEKLLWSGDER